MRFMAAEVARALSGELVGANAHLEGVSFDSRSITPGQLFVPIVAQRDGHEFIADALSRRAGAYLTEIEPQGRTAIKVVNTIAALLSLGTWARERLSSQLQGRVIGITGSVGKTSTKDFVASALAISLRVHANDRSFNNDFGLPTTILNAPDDTQVLVLEMGMRGFGEIARLCSVAKPHIAVVTSVANAHTQQVGSIEGVARAKRELIEALPDDGVAILNADNEYVLAMRNATQARVVTFGESEHADVQMTSCVLDDLGCATITVKSPWGKVAMSMRMPGRHMAHNAMAALCVSGVLELDVVKAAEAIASSRISPSRMQRRVLKSGTLVLDDSYNANPMSMRAALETLAIISGSRRIAFCGLMAELAEPTVDHLAIARHALELGIELVAVNTDLYGVTAINFDEAKKLLASLTNSDVALVKGSKVTGLSTLCDGLEHSGV